MTEYAAAPRKGAGKTLTGITGTHSEVLRLQGTGLLSVLLQDKTTKRNIVWGSGAYARLGEEYRPEREITPRLITGTSGFVLCSRAEKSSVQRQERTRASAEVFTPLGICRLMNDHADSVWFGKKGATDGGQMDFSGLKPKRGLAPWQMYADARRLEITCGEAPFLVSRYDASTGEKIPVAERTGLLDRKLRAVGENAADIDEWHKWALRALQSVYGYEYQGDNLLIARINALMDYEEHMLARWGAAPSQKRLAAAANVIAWNLWQMDGLTCRVPCAAREQPAQMTLFGEEEKNAAMPDGQMTLFGDVQGARTEIFGEEEPPAPLCKVYDWRRQNSREFIGIGKGERRMKFDFVIGNPPYQEENVGKNNQARPIYHFFMDSAYKIASKVELITPARFLTEEGGTSNAWNKKILSSNKIKVLHYFRNSKDVFSGVDIKGGVVIIYFDKNANFEPIGVFIHDDILYGIFDKTRRNFTGNVGDLVHSPDSYRFTDVMFQEHPELVNRTDKQHAKAVSSSVFARYPEIFFESEQNDSVKIVGRNKGKRVIFWTYKRYLNDPGNINTWKLLIAGAIGSGKYGEVLSEPIVMGPDSAHTQTFVSMGEFETEYEAKALYKYIKTKFSRALLGIMKTTHNNQSKTTWSKIPLQDFTEKSDIDWSQDVAGIDRQLYAKYGLTDAEIAFIETHVKEMA